MKAGLWTFFTAAAREHRSSEQEWGSWCEERGDDAPRKKSRSYEQIACDLYRIGRRAWPW